MNREIVLDTETTGLSPITGDRVVEIGCVELLNHMPTGRHFHIYLNPDRLMNEEAFRVHGLSNEFLADKPRFGEKAAELLEFLGDSALIAHNAQFDVDFINMELGRVGRGKISNQIIDTVVVAHQKHPGAKVSLDALCKFYGIDNSKRTLHGALLDSEILADVYLELVGGRQGTFALVPDEQARVELSITRAPARQRPSPLASRISDAELVAHAAFIATIGDAALWHYYEHAAAA